VYGAYLLAVWDAEGEEYQSISKIGTGFDEAQLAAFHALLKPTVVDQAKPYYKCALRPRGVVSLCANNQYRREARARADIPRGYQLEPSRRRFCSGLARPG